MERIKRASLYIFFGLLGYMPLHIFLSTWIGTTFGVLELAKVLKDIVLAAGFLLALVVAIRERWYGKILHDRLVWIIAAYALLTVLLALFKPTDQDAEILGVVYNLRFLLFFLYGVMLTHMYKAVWLRRNALRVVLIVALPVLIFGAIQYLWLPNDALTHAGYRRANGVLPAFFIDDKPDLERVMSTVRDPNSFGSYVLIILAIAVVYLLQVKNKNLKQALTGMAVLCVLCLYFTFSRGAWIGAVMTVGAAVLLYAKQKSGFKIDRKLWMPAAALLILSANVLFFARDSYFVQNVIFHADESTVLEDPNQLRTRFWRESVEAAVDNPLGHGPGTAGLASLRNDIQGGVLNENYYLQILYEAGILGVILFIAILFLVGKRLYETSQDTLSRAVFAAFIGLLATNFLVHIWSNEAVAYTWWGLAGLILLVGQGRNVRRA